jgi:hypothetical protein
MTDTELKPSSLILPEFESLVQRIIQTVDKVKLAELRRDFHTRLRITLTQPDSAELIEDLWDFFYDWCVFERNLPDTLDALPTNVATVWTQVKSGNQRGLYTVQKVGDDGLKLKDLYSAKVFTVPQKHVGDFIGISKGDIIEGRLVQEEGSKDGTTNFVRRPSFHPVEVHDYIKKKVKQFKKEQDFPTYQTWLWLLVGMYLKHRIYNHMPIEKIYDDNSRI